MTHMERFLRAGRVSELSNRSCSSLVHAGSIPNTGRKELKRLTGASTDNRHTGAELRNADSHQTRPGEKWLRYSS